MEFFTPQTINEKRKEVLSQPIPSTIFPGLEYRDNYSKLSPGDSALWLKMFVKADEKHGRELCSMLMFVRNTGSVLVPNETYGRSIRPIIGVNGWDREDQCNENKSGDMDCDKCGVQCYFKETREMRKRYRAEIIELLKSLGR